MTGNGRRAGRNADQRPERRRHRRRIRHAGRSLSRSALSGLELLPHPARHPQRRGAGQRQAHRSRRTGWRPGRPCAFRRCGSMRPKPRAPGNAADDKTARIPQIHHALRRRRRAGAQQADGACGAGRLRHHAPSRRHAGSVARRARPAAAAGAPARQGHRRLPAVAKTRFAAAALAKTFRSRSARKVYWALVAGVPKVQQGRISTFLAKEEREDESFMRIARHGEKGASHAVTYYAVVETSGPLLAWLSLKPVTGRTHQLRAHMAHIGHPIVGDPKYFSMRELGAAGRHAEQAASPRPPHRRCRIRAAASSTSPRRCRRTCSNPGTCSGSTPSATIRSRKRRRIKRGTD